MLRRVGFFRELRHGLPDGPSIHAACRRKLWPDYQLAAEYLRSGSTVVTAGVLTDDIIDPKNTQIAPLAVLSDGVWVWPADLAHYVERYQCELPVEFLEHMRRAGWVPPVLAHGELVRIGRELRLGAS